MSDPYDFKDPYTYPGSDVLINIPDFRNQAELAAFEKQAVEVRLIHLPELTAPSAQGFRDLHQHLFQDVYPFAGQDRTVTLSKAGTRFCNHQFIAKEMDKRFVQIAQDTRLEKGNSPADFVSGVAEHIVEVNAIHPFREGNGRTMRAFITQLAARANLRFSVQKVDRRKWLEASVIGYLSADDAPMRACLAPAISVSRDRRVAELKQAASVKYDRSRDRD